VQNQKCYCVGWRQKVCKTRSTTASDKDKDICKTRSTIRSDKDKKSAKPEVILRLFKAYAWVFMRVREFFWLRGTLIYEIQTILPLSMLLMIFLPQVYRQHLAEQVTCLMLVNKIIRVPTLYLHSRDWKYNA